jgi:hypothetical protein
MVTIVTLLEKGGMQMGYKTKIQLIRRENSKQWYVNFPYQVAEVMGFEKGEVFEWILVDKSTLKLKRLKR